MVLWNGIAVTNGKGGVLKTSITANVAGLAAAGGWRTLVVDCDPQGNLGRDLGYMDDADDGEALADAVINRTRPDVLSEVRPRLDVVAGGPAIRTRLLPEMQRRMLSGAIEPLNGFAEAFATMANDYDLIMVDTPPGEAVIQAAIMRTVQWLVIPTRPDAASIDGLATVAQVASEQRAVNPELSVLGIVLGPVPASATALAREARSEVQELVGEELHVFDTVIRDAPRLAFDLRQRGQLAHEYEAAAATAEPWWKAVRLGKRPASFSSADLAGDYQGLANDIIARYSQRAQEAATHG